MNKTINKIKEKGKRKIKDEIRMYEYKKGDVIEHNFGIWWIFETITRLIIIVTVLYVLGLNLKEGGAFELISIILILWAFRPIFAQLKEAWRIVQLNKELSK